MKRSILKFALVGIIIQAAVLATAHAGPTSERVFAGNDLAINHSRLAISDLSQNTLIEIGTYLPARGATSHLTEKHGYSNYTGKKEVFNFSLVNKRFHSAVKEALKESTQMVRISAMDYETARSVFTSTDLRGSYPGLVMKDYQFAEEWLEFLPTDVKLLQVWATDNVHLLRNLDRFTNLRELTIQGGLVNANQEDLRYILNSIGSMKNLRLLDLSYNKLKTLDLSGLSNLEYLDLGANELKTIKGFDSLEMLKKVNLSANPLSSDFDLSNQTHLISIELRYCRNKVLGRLSNTLRFIHLNANYFTEEQSEEIERSIPGCKAVLFK